MHVQLKQLEIAASEWVIWRLKIKYRLNSTKIRLTDTNLLLIHVYSELDSVYVKYLSPLYYIVIMRPCLYHFSVNKIDYIVASF